LEPLPSNQPEFEEVWLKVDEAVAYCTSQGLSRTAKTIRKWAERSFNIPEGEVVSRREDTLWGRYRWNIEKVSLERKVAEELSREQENGREPVQTSLNNSKLDHADSFDLASSNSTKTVRTGADDQTQNEVNAIEATKRKLIEPLVDHVRTGSDINAGSLSELATLRAENKELRLQQDRDRDEITFLRDEVTFNRSLKTDFAQTSHRLLETLETLAIGGKVSRSEKSVERQAQSETSPVRYQQVDTHGGEV
jgi:hypothetical protein